MMRKFTTRMELKEINEKGRFIGHASVYGNVDDGGDIVMPGAMRKTVQENGGKFPLMYNHRDTIGVSFVEDSEKSLVTEGFINLDSPKGAETHSNMVFFQSKGMPFGMSIGYAPIHDKITRKNGIRSLHEIVLFETTVTETPMNRAARVSDVKSILEELTEWKAGRRISAASAARLEAAMNEIRSLYAEPEENGEPEADLSGEPQILHSMLSDLKKSIPASLFS